MPKKSHANKITPKLSNIKILAKVRFNLATKQITQQKH